MHVFQNACVRFYSGNPQIGYKTKYRFEYSKLQEMMILKGVNLFKEHYQSIGGSHDDQYDTLWNKMCQRAILTLLLLKNTV